MLGGVGNIGTMSARRRVIAAGGGGGGGGGSADALGARSGTADSDHVHTISGLNTLFMIPHIHYIGHQLNNDNDENYSVKDILFTSGSNASHTFYLAVKIQSNTSTFHNDLCVGAIQIHTDSAVVFAGGAEDASGFTTVGQSTNADPTGLTFAALGTSTGSGTFWHVRSSTNSGNTGATDSIATTFQNTANPLPNAAEENIAQASSTNYLGSEGSGGTLNTFQYLKFTASLATNTAHRFVFAYNFGIVASDTRDDEDDNVGLYIEN